MYVPDCFAMNDLDAVAAFVARSGAADLVTFDGARPAATLLPVIWDRSGGGNGRLLGHMALANRQWSTAAPGAEGLAIVHGPQAYVSPSWYPSKAEHGRAVPTWNYVSVHFTGPVTFHRDEAWLRDVVTRLTDLHEARRLPDGAAERWHVTDAPERYIAGQLRAIVGVELAVTSVEAKAKLSQNRPEADRASVAAALRAAPEAGARAVGELMDASAPG